MGRLNRTAAWGIVALGFALATVPSFLGTAQSPMLIVVGAGGKPGIIEPNQFKTLLDRPLPEYVAWSRRDRGNQTSELQYLRETLRTVAPGRSPSSDWFPLGWLTNAPAYEAWVKTSTFDRQSRVEKAQETSIWKDATRGGLRSPIPMPDEASPTRVHLARIPPRAARGAEIGHVEPDANREAVWIRSIEVPPSHQPGETGAVHAAEAPAVRPAQPGETGEPPSSPARELKPGDYLVGWLVVITKCGDPDGCKLASSGEATCLKPETLTDHVLGMTHLIVPRAWLYGPNDRHEPILRSDIPNGGGLVLLAGADYDYASLRVSLYTAGAGASADPKNVGDPIGGRPSWTRESSIAMLDERLHEILTRINRARNLNDGDLVLILPTALDFSLGERDYLIVGLGDVPPPLRSHHRAASGPSAQDRKPAARISAAVDE